MIQRLLPAALAAAWLVFGSSRPASAAIEAPDISLIEQEQKIKSDSEAKIQKDVIDPILGPGKAMVFVDVQLEFVAVSSATSQVQAGAAERYKQAETPPGAGYGPSDYILPGVPRPRTALPTPPERPEQSQQQQAQQQQQATQNRYSVRTIVRQFKVTVIHDSSISKDRIDLVRDRIVDAMSKYDLKPESILFKPTEFSKAPPWQEFRQPGVLVPLLFAALLFMLLMFLFGPVSVYMGRYIRTLQDKQEPHIDVESRFENAPGMQGGISGGALEGSFEHLSKSLEEQEAEEMKKFEPFKYINSENLRRLAYLVRREEPWVIAVVLTYLAPEFARVVLSGLPRELQSRVALEMATIRQVSKDQVAAIDSEIKDRVDFVLGGVDHLSRMLEDADEASRQNILEYLQNERPSLYEKVRQAIIMFEDIANFQDREMQTVVRELKTENMARALQNSSPEMLDKFFNNMSTGAASLLKEAMEFEKDLTELQVSAERKKIMDVVKRLERDGRIVIRDMEAGKSLEGLEEEVSVGEARKSKWGSKPQTVTPGLQGGMGYPMGMGFPPMGVAPMGLPMMAAPVPTPAPSPEPVPAAKSAPMTARPVEEEPAKAGRSALSKAEEAEARSYLDAGISTYDEGRYEDALQYLEYAAAISPSLWQAEQYIGLSLYALDRNEEAMAHFDRLLELQPSQEMKEWVLQMRSAA